MEEKVDGVLVWSSTRTGTEVFFSLVYPVLRDSVFNLTFLV